MPKIFAKPNSFTNSVVTKSESIEDLPFKTQWCIDFRKAALKPSQIVRFLFATICFGWFCFNAQSIIRQYLQFNTIVSLQLNPPNEIDFPGVTICGPFIIGNEVLEQTYSEYLYVENQTLANSTTIRSILQRRQKISDLRDVYEEKAFRDFNAIHIFDELSVKLDNLIIKCEFQPKVHRDKLNAPMEDAIRCRDIMPIVSSIYEGRKCFTFFSQLNNSQSNVKMVYNNNPIISLQVMARHNIWPVGPIQMATLILAVHPPNIIPTHLDFDYVRIYPNHAYDLRFIKKIEYLKPPPYRTNCRQYRVTDPRGERSRGDCINTCIKRETFSVNNCANYYGILTRDLFTISDHICERKLQDYIQYTKARKLCMSRCQLNCVEESHDIHSYEFSDYHSLNLTEHADAVIEIKSHCGPYTIIRHTEEINQSEFIGTLGGHAGIWLGLSVITIFNSIVKLIGYCKR